MIAHNRFYSLDGLRGFAAIAVMFHHCDARFLPGGYQAVDFFFCLSRLAIARSYGEKLDHSMGARLFMELQPAWAWLGELVRRRNAVQLTATA